MSLTKKLTTLAIVAAAATLTATGCQYSNDRFIYDSTAWYPQTVTLIDTRTGESVWTVDVPVGQQVIVGFRSGAGPNSYNPDVMYWSLTEAGRKVGPTRNQMAVPAASARLLVPSRRTSPEYPDAALPGTPHDQSTDEYDAGSSSSGGSSMGDEG